MATKIRKLWETTYQFNPSGVPDIPLPPGADKALLGDFFVTLPIGRVGAESRNDRMYPRATMESMVDTLNNSRPLGWWGHSEDFQRSTAEPSVRWLGAQISDDGMVWGKLVPLTDAAKRYFEVATATNALVGNSLYGEGEMGEDGHTVQNLRVHYIDILANPDWVGVPETAGLVRITSESFNEKEQLDMPYSEAEIKKFAEDSARLATVEATLTANFGGATAAEALANVNKLRDDAITTHIGAVVADKVKIPHMRPLVIRMITEKPKTTAEADAAIEKILTDPFVMEALKAASPGQFGGNMQGEAGDANKQNNGGTASNWREAAIKNAEENAKRIGAKDPRLVR